MITPEQNARLKAPFPAHEHEFIGDYLYIKEDSIANRLDEVDPSWSFEIYNTIIEDTRVSVYARMTISGVSRDGIGTGAVIKNNSKAEPEKSAATDALKRCARLFGIGRHILSMPKDDQNKPMITDYASLRKWLDLGMDNAAFMNTPDKPQNAANRPNNAKSGQATQSTPPQSDAPVETELTHIEIKADKNGKPYLVFITKDNKRVSVFTRKDFIEAGWIEDTDWKEVAPNRQLRDTIPARIQYDGQYWQLVEVGQPVF